MTVVECATGRLAQGGAAPLVLMRSDHEALLETLAHAAQAWPSQWPRIATRTVPPELADLGMGHTLAEGVRATADAAGWVVALGDMPALQASTVAAVVRALADGASIAAPWHKGRRGHPVGFAAHWRDALMRLHGDAGARELLHAHAHEITAVPVDDPGCLQDLDTPADWPRLEALLNDAPR